jgi:hypothetical protein
MTVNLSDKEIYLLFNKLDRFKALRNKFTVMIQSSFQLRVRKRFIELAACVIDTFFSFVSDALYNCAVVFVPGKFFLV